MNFLYALVLKARLWDCDFAIQRCNSRIAALRQEVVEREAEEAALQAELFDIEHQMRREM